MDCKACGIAGAPGQRFCMKCGQPMEEAALAPRPGAEAAGQACPVCGALGKPGMVFCTACGTAFTATVPPPPKPVLRTQATAPSYVPQPAEPPPYERRQGTPRRRLRRNVRVNCRWCCCWCCSWPAVAWRGTSSIPVSRSPSRKPRRRSPRRPYRCLPRRPSRWRSRRRPKPCRQRPSRRRSRSRRRPHRPFPLRRRAARRRRPAAWRRPRP